MPNELGIPSAPDPNVVAQIERRDERITLTWQRPLGRPPYLVIRRERIGRRGTLEVTESLTIWNRELTEFAHGVGTALEQSIAFSREQREAEQTHLGALDAEFRRRDVAEISRELRVLRRADRRPDFFDRLYRLKSELYIAAHGWQAPFPSFVLKTSGTPTVTRVRLARKNSERSTWDFSVHFSWAVFPEGADRPRNTNPRQRPPRNGLRLLASEIKPATLVWDVVDGATRLVCVPDPSPRGAICWQCRREVTSADAPGTFVPFQFTCLDASKERTAFFCSACAIHGASPSVHATVLRRLRAEGWPLAAHVDAMQFTSGE